MKTETRAISALKAHPANYRRHPEKQLTILRDSLRIHGQQKPVVVQPDGTILAGHGLVEAARLEGWDEISVHEYDGPYPDAFLAIDNYTSDLADDDPQALLALLKQADAAGELLATGYDADALLAVLAEANKGQDRGDGGGGRETDTWVEVTYRLPVSAAAVVEEQINRIMGLCGYGFPGLALERMAILAATTEEIELTGESAVRVE